MWNVECGMWNVECGMWNVECGNDTDLSKENNFKIRKKGRGNWDAGLEISFFVLYPLSSSLSPLVLVPESLFYRIEIEFKCASSVKCNLVFLNIYIRLQFLVKKSCSV